MSLDFYLEATVPTTVFEANITHNLSGMAREAGIYDHLWDPFGLGIKKASELIEPLIKGLNLLKAEPERFEKFNPKNGWGDYYGFVDFVEKVLKACTEHPDASVRTWV